MRVVFKPITSLSFRKPGPFGITQRGPTAVSDSYKTKLTTLLGALAYLGYLKNSNCSSVSSENPLKSVKSCLKQVVQPPLRGPFVSLNGALSFGEEELYPLSPLLNEWGKIKERLKELVEGKVVLKRKKKALVKYKDGLLGKYLRSGSAYGNMLNKQMKVSDAVYLKKRMYYKDVEFFFEVKGLAEDLGARGLKETITLGGDWGVAEVRTEGGRPVEESLKKLWDEEWERNGVDAVIVVVSPLILAENCDGAEELVNDPLQVFKKDVSNDVEAVPLLRRYTIDVYHLGWDLNKNVPRPALPAVLPGSAVIARGLKLTPKGLYERGLGEFRELGFGTLIPLPISN